MAQARTRQRRQAANGNGSALRTLHGNVEDAVVYEQEIAEEAQAIWDEHDGVTLDARLLAKLLPLLRRPIPGGYIVSIPATEGKPYESTGIRSMQVQIDRLDNVLGPHNWGWRTEYMEEGKLARVTAWIGPEPEPLVVRSAMGGVNRGSTVGNLYKGSETNAGKLALARLGPGHEVYVGATDLDPDVNVEAAAEQGKAEQAPPVAGISAESAAKLIDDYHRVKSAHPDPEKFIRNAKLKLGGMGVPTPTLNRAIASLTPSQAVEFDAWLAGQAPEGGEQQ